MPTPARSGSTRTNKVAPEGPVWAPGAPPATNHDPIAGVVRDPGDRAHHGETAKQQRDTVAASRANSSTTATDVESGSIPPDDTPSEPADSSDKPQQSRGQPAQVRAHESRGDKNAAAPNVPTIVPPAIPTVLISSRATTPATPGAISQSTGMEMEPDGRASTTESLQRKPGLGDATNGPRKTPAVAESAKAPAQPAGEADPAPCNVCGKPGTFECSRCRKVVYCSSECQRADWKDHRVACKAFAKKARQAKAASVGAMVTRRSSKEGAESRISGQPPAASSAEPAPGAGEANPGASGTPPGTSEVAATARHADTSGSAESTLSSKAATLQATPAALALSDTDDKIVSEEFPSS